MQAGKLRKRLTFLTKSDATNGFGEQTEWVPFYTCFGSVDALNAQLQYQTDVFISQSTYNIRIRYTASQNFDVGDHIKTEDGTLFEIKGILNPEMRNREIQFLAYVINQQVQ